MSSPNCGDKVEVQFLFMAYSLGVRVHPPLYILNNVVELVYNGSISGWYWKEIPKPLRVRKIQNRKTNAIKTEIEVVSIF